MMTDPIADLLTRIRNGLMVRKEKVYCPYSRLKENILAVLKEEGFLTDYRVLEPSDVSYKMLEISLKYDENGNPAIQRIRRESRPGRRVYKSADEIEKILGGFGIGIYSTNQGVLSDRQCRQRRVGGEFLCSLW